MSEQEDVIAQAMADAAGGVANVDDDKLSVISMLAIKQTTLAARVVKLEKDLETAQKELKQVQEIDLPNALLDVSMRSFTLADGSKVETKKVYVASVKVENRHDAFAWMINQGHEALIKTEVNLDVGKGEVELAEEVKTLITEYLKSKEVDLVPMIEQSVHWQTLRAFVKEQIEAEEARVNDGEVIPPEEVLPRELLGVHIFEKATVTPPKPNKRKK